MMNKIVLLLVCVMLSACGFHLRGTQAFDRLPYQAWYVSGGEMQQALENALRRVDGQAVPATQAQASIVVTGIQTQKDVFTITQAAIINEYLLVLRVNAQAYRDGQPWGEPMTVMVRHTMDYSDSEVLGKPDEEALIRQEMRQDAAQQIVRRLAFLKESNHAQLGD